MATNSKQRGHTVSVLAENVPIISGDLVQAGKIVGVALGNAQVGSYAVLETVGVFSLPKDTAESFTTGQKLYLHNGVMSSHQSSVFVGHSWGNFPTEASDCEVRLSFFGNEQLLNVVYVEDIEGFPEPIPQEVGPDLITLEAGNSYIVTSFVDLQGARIVAGGNVFLGGLSSETCGLLSTGLTIQYPLISSAYDLPMQNIDINSLWCVDLDGTGNEAAIDWKAVNFSDSPKVATVKNVTNFVFESSALLNSKGLIFDGTIGTIAFETMLFSGQFTAGAIVDVLSTATITRRFRVIFSSFIASGSEVAIDFSTSASIPLDQYILFKCNFSGGGTYINGVQSDDNKADFEGNKGISNSGSVSQFYMNDNAVATTIAAAGDFVKIAGATTSATITQRFTNTDNRATYTGAVDGIYKVSAVVSMNSGNNQVLRVRTAKNGTTAQESQSKVTTSGNGRSENIKSQSIFALTSGDYIEVFATNDTATNSVTATDLNVIVERLK